MIQHLPSLEYDAIVILAAFFPLLFIKMLQMRLYRHYPWVFSYQAIQCALSFSAVAFGTSSAVYARIFDYSSLPILLASILIAHELMWNLYRINPGLKVFNRRALRLGIGLAIVLAAPSAYATHARWHDPEFACMIWVWLEATRVTEIGIVVYLLHLIVASKRQGVSFPRNLRIFTLGFLMIFATDALGSTLFCVFRLMGPSVYVLNLIMLSCTILFNGASIIWLEPESAHSLTSEPLSLDENVLSRLNSLQQVVQVCARSVVR
jgi:hypothetical protein